MFISAFILVICFAAMVQFAVFSWRAGLLRTIATEPAGEQAEMTAAISHNIMNGKDFADISSLQGLCPDLKKASGSLRSVRVYYSFLKLMNGLGDAIVAPGARRLRRLDQPRDGAVRALYGCGIVAAAAQ